MECAGKSRGVTCHRQLCPRGVGTIAPMPYGHNQEDSKEFLTLASDEWPLQTKAYVSQWTHGARKVDSIHQQSDGLAGGNAIILGH